MATLVSKALAFLPYTPLLFLIYFVTTRTLTWYRLRHFPGPFLGKFSYAFMAKTAWSGKMNLIYTDVTRRYGSLARVGPNDLITSSPSTIRKMSSARSPYLRSEWYDAMRLDPYIDNLLSERSISVHDVRRAKMSLGYSGKENPFLEPDIDACIGALVALIRRKYLSVGDAVRPADVGRMAHFLTLDIITKVAYGEAFGFVEGDRDVHEYIRTSEEVVGWITLFAVVPAAQQFVNRGWVRRNFGPGPGDRKGIGKLMGVAEKVVAERFGPDAKVKADMLGAFVRNGIPKRQIQAEVLLQIVAGSDTTATAIRATMLYLTSNHRAMTKLRKEIDEAESEGRISHPISNAQAKKLPYLQAVIKEGLRIHPPFTGLVMKEVPPQGDTIEGQFVPGGTKVGLSVWAMMRDPMFGEDVEVFRPERWIEVDEERYTKMEQTVELVFGYGRWVCLGKTVALIELNKVFVELLRQFDFESINPGIPWRSQNFNLFMQDQMWMRISERERV